jgi:hypothetical protein
LDFNFFFIFFNQDRREWPDDLELKTLKRIVKSQNTPSPLKTLAKPSNFRLSPQFHPKKHIPPKTPLTTKYPSANTQTSAAKTPSKLK